MNDTTEQLTINPRFKSLIPPLSDEEFRQLEENILADKRVREPIVIWKDQIIDGHNRYEIATKHGLDFDVHCRTFESEDEACAWMLSNQLGRRNVSKMDQRILRGELYKLKNAGTARPNNRENFHGGQNVHDGGTSARTAKEIAAQTGVNERTVRRDAKFVDTLHNLASPLQDRIRSGSLRLPDRMVAELAKRSHGEQLQLDRDIRVGNKSSWPHALGLVEPPKVNEKTAISTAAMEEHRAYETIKQVIRRIDGYAEAAGKLQTPAHRIAAAAADNLLSAWKELVGA